MKKIFYLFTLVTLMFASCNPLEDTYEELDILGGGSNVIVGDVVRTLNDDDYDALDLSFGNFSSEDQVKSLLPEFLLDEYPVFGATSTAVITYKLYSPIKYEAYTVTDADYTAIGLTSLNDSGDYNDFFSYKFPSEAKGTVVDLTYKAEPTIIDYTLTNDDFDLVGNGRFDNFDIRTGRDEETVEVRRAKIQTILLNNFPDAVDGTIYNVTYAIYDGSAGTLEMTIKQQQNQPDPALTTNYTLTEADFDLVGNGNFDNFDIRPGRDEETIEVRRAKIETILLNNFPTASTGDLYNVTYAVWEGFDSTRVMLVEFDGAGYNIFSTTSYELYTFALEDVTTRFTLSDEWDAPITFTDEEYTLMGESFPNFSDEEEAEYKIGIYLRTLYQFAAPEDFVAVEYKYYDGSVKTENINFVFDGTVWNAIPTVIDSVLKFGHNGITWVPDNTIKYTLTNADFALVGNGRFNNFDVRVGKDEETVEARRVKINTILLNNFPELGEGQKFLVSYAVYSGAAEIFTMNLINNGTDYVLQ